MYVCMYIYVCIYIYIYIYLFMYLCIYIYTYIHMLCVYTGCVLNLCSFHFMCSMAFTKQLAAMFTYVFVYLPFQASDHMLAF